MLTGESVLDGLIHCLEVEEEKKKKKRDGSNWRRKKKCTLLAGLSFQSFLACGNVVLPFIIIPFMYV